MPNINAALGLAQLEQLPDFLRSKRLIAQAYNKYFNIELPKQIKSDTFQQIYPSTLPQKQIIHISEPLNSTSNYWLNCIFFSSAEERDAFLKYTNENAVMTRPAWRLMNELDMFKNCETDELINAKEISERLVNIPSSVLKS
jgi:perosamine synthetase